MFKKLILETTENEPGRSGELQVTSRKNGEGKGVDGAEHEIWPSELYIC